MKSTHPSIAIVGAGAVTLARHLPALRAVGGRAVSVYDPSRTAATAAAEAFTIPHVASTAEEAISSDGAEAVLIASPNAFHRDQALCALDAGRHVLCEKPVALTLADARTMANAAKRAGKVVQVGFHHRFSAEHNCVKRLIECGVLGDVRAFSGAISEPLEVIPGGLKNYRFDARQGGGFTLIDVGQHRIDQVRDLFGDIGSVSCEMASVLESHNMDDSVVLTVKMASGSLGSLSWHRFSRAFTSPLMLYGTKATAGCSAFITAPFQSAPVSVFMDDDPAVRLPPDVLAWTRPSKWWSDVEPGWVDIWPPRRKTFQDQFRNFFDAIAGRASPAASLEDGYKALEVVQASYQSFREQRAVQLPVEATSHSEPPTW